MAIMEFLKIREENATELKLVYGIRLESDNGNSYDIRFLLKHADMSDSFLGKMKTLFGSIFFLSDTAHIIPNLLKTGIDKQISFGRGYSELWKYVGSNDMFSFDVNEMSIFCKGSKICSNIKSTINNPVNSANDSSQPGPSRSIFDRLLPRESGLSHLEEMNFSMGFRKASNNNNNARTFKTKKIKSVIRKV